MNINAEVGRDLAADFDIHLASEIEALILQIVCMSVAAVFALEVGMRASYVLLPPLEWYGMLRFDEAEMEQTEESECQLDGWSVRRERGRYW